MNFLHFLILLISITDCLTGPLEDIANTPDLSLFYQQLIRQQDIQMLLQNIYPQQQPGGMNDFTIFAPNNDAMTHLTRKHEDPNLLWKYHIVPGRYDEQMLYNMAQTKINQANPRQMIDMRAQNNLPTIALPFQVFYGLGFYGGTGPHVNESYDNAGYGQGGISWLTHTSFNQTNLFDANVPHNPSQVINHNNNQRQNAFSVPNSFLLNSQNFFPANITNYQNSPLQMNGPTLQAPPMTNMNFNPYVNPVNYGPSGSFGNIGALRPTINNAFILHSRPMSRGVIHVIDQILWPPERRDQTQYKTAYDVLEDRQFSRLRQLADRSDFFRSELRAMHHQTWFLPTDQAFASMGTTLSFLFDQFLINNTNDINEFIRAHAVPIVLFPSAMDSTKQITTLTENKWVTFRKVTQSDHTFQVDIVSARHVARILISRPEEIRLFGNGVVYPISAILSSQIRSAADEIIRSYQYFMNLVQQSGDMELMNTLQGTTNMNMFNPQRSPNITVLIPQLISAQQLGNAQDLSMHLRRHVLLAPVYTDESMVTPAVSSSFPQPHIHQSWQQEPSIIPQQQPFIPQQQQPLMHQPQQPLIPQPQQPFIPQQQQPLMPQPQQSFTPQSQIPFVPDGFNQQQFQMPQFQRTGSMPDKKVSRYRRQMSILPNANFPSQQYPQQQLPNQQIPPIQQPQTIPFQQQQPVLPPQTQPFTPNFYPMPSYPSATTFQHGQQYPTMDPQFSVQAQISSGASGNIISLIGRTANSLPFTATIINSESNIQVKNGVMHVIRGIVSGMILPLERILTLIQGTSGFTQLLQQTRVLEQLKQSGRSYTLFIPTNAALQSIGSTTNLNQLRQFVLRHICADVLLDPASNVLRRSAGYYNLDQRIKTKLQSSRRKRQDWMNSGRNQTNFMNRHDSSSFGTGSGYFQQQNQQQPVYGDHSAPSPPYGSNNQMYNPSYTMNGYATQNSAYRPTFNRSYSNGQNLNYNNWPTVNQPNPNMLWNMTKNVPFNPQINAAQKNQPQSYYSSQSILSGPTYISGPQSCVAMTGERITVQSLAGPLSEVNPPAMSFQNYMVTCCGDQSINAMVQSYNIYPPNFAIYVIGRSLLSQGKTINTMYNHTIKLTSSNMVFLFFIISLILKQIHEL